MSAPAGARRFIVRGRVQGVGFRFFVVDQARELGLAGFTRNLPDGTVEVQAAGGAESLDRLAGALARGPALSRVDGVEASPAAADPSWVDFHISH